MDENRPSTNGFTRRRALACFAAMGGLTVAGCLGDDVGGPASESGNDDGDDENGGDGNSGHAGENDSGDATDEPSAPVDATIETTGSNCGSPEDDEIAVDVVDHVITVTGVLPAPNPCHDAVLEDVELDAGQLSLVVDVRDATAEDESCIQCHGKIEYEARLEPAAGVTVDRLVVEHVTGERHEESLAEFDSKNDEGKSDEGTSDGDPVEIVSTSIETVDTDCGGADDERVDVEPAGDTIFVAGVLPASNPCHEAVIEDATIDDGRLSLAIDVRSTLDDGGVCIECVGSVEYEATVEVTDGARLDSVHVDHETGGDHAVGWDRASEHG